jgi:hypothetical protein
MHVLSRIYYAYRICTAFTSYSSMHTCVLMSHRAMAQARHGSTQSTELQLAQRVQKSFNGKSLLLSTLKVSIALDMLTCSY